MRRYTVLLLLGIFCAALQGMYFSEVCTAADRASVGSPSAVTKTNPDASGKKTPSELKKNEAPDKKEVSEEKEAPEKTKAPEEKKEETSEKRGRTTKPEPQIRVGLSEGQASAVIASNAAYILSDVKMEKEIEKFGAGKVATVTVKSGKLVVNGKTVEAKALRFSVEDSRAARQLTVAGEKYRGNVVLKLADDGTITVINEVKLDDYIGGVISEEMSPDWPAEALKAQAVAARTFAVYSLGLHDEDGYDVCATTHCQVFGGVESESPEGLRAVSATRGEIMTYQGKAIYAAFHSSSGGMTAGSEEGGGTALPYLKAVRDPQDEATPNHHWQVSMTVKELSSELAQAGFSVGTLKAIELSPLHLGQGASDRYPSGRLSSIRFIGSKQAISVSGPKLRWIVDLPSTLVDVRYGKGKNTTPNTKGKIEISDQNASIVFDGYGRGHGIGLSQWGAYAMAAKSNYREILSHYYKDVEFTFLF